MGIKQDYHKDFKSLYIPKSEPEIISVPSIRFALIDGEGDPNGEGFGFDTAALYAFSYAVKMSYKSKDIPLGFYDYTVFPLEGEWDLIDKSKPITDKSNFRYRIMIRQPDFLTAELFIRFLNAAKEKKTDKKTLISLDKIKFAEIEEGMCCQMMHIGPFSDEPLSFERMERFCREKGYKRMFMGHREIYLSDPRKTAPEKLKTVLRFRIEDHL